MRYVTAVTLAALLALPAQAGAMIQIDRGIAGARLGNSQNEVRAALGEPALVKTGTNEFGPWRQFYFEGGIRVFFQGDDDVTSVMTLGRGDRTAKGIGIGSTEKALKQKHPNFMCESAEGLRFCHTGIGEPGERVTDFQIKRGRVVRAVVAIIID
ncbi:MAG: hypothetical protein M3340_15610 [Actinomycetota bacterium]|nr:hypothetical protein [Actinomycetota bacterium]